MGLSPCGICSIPGLMWMIFVKGYSMSQIDRARHIARTFGTYRAARYMRTRGWSLEAALWALRNQSNNRKG